MPLEIRHSPFFRCSLCNIQALFYAPRNPNNSCRLVLLFLPAVELPFEFDPDFKIVNHSSHEARLVEAASMSQFNCYRRPYIVTGQRRDALDVVDLDRAQRVNRKAAQRISQAINPEIDQTVGPILRPSWSQS